jgi:hypothetical protein
MSFCDFTWSFSPGCESMPKKEASFELDALGRLSDASAEVTLPKTMASMAALSTAS